MFTRTKDLESRIIFDLQTLSYSNNYQFGTPGNGLNVSYITNPEIRLQKWGGNLANNALNLEHDLFGQTRKLNRDNAKLNSYLDNRSTITKRTYPKQQIAHSYSRVEDAPFANKEKSYPVEPITRNVVLFENHPQSTRERA